MMTGIAPDSHAKLSYLSILLRLKFSLSDYKVLGKYYYFSTLTTIGINNINVVYSSSNYQEKSIDVTYNLDRIFGYEKIVYTIQKLNEATNTYETVIDNIQDTLFKREMLKQFDCRPGSEFEFNKKYKIIITPIATIQNEDGTTKELDVGTTEKEFELAALNTPLYGITGKRDSNNNIIFTNLHAILAKSIIS